MDNTNRTVDRIVGKVERIFSDIRNDRGWIMTTNKEDAEEMINKIKPHSLNVSMSESDPFRKHTIRVEYYDPRRWSERCEGWVDYDIDMDISIEVAVSVATRLNIGAPTIDRWVYYDELAKTGGK